MRRVSQVVAVVGVIAAGLLLAACSSTTSASKVAGMPRRTTSVRNVEVTVTPTRLDASGASFSVALDTHSGSLDVDVAKGATLTVGEVRWTNPTWKGDNPGGHHRNGALEFTAAGTPSNDVTLTLAGFAAPIVIRWPS
jgi:FlaG/FlaF family flagellin (archaellin)